MRFSSLSSGSAGNATFLQSGDTRILIDQGLSVRLLASRLAQIGETLSGLSGIVCSHSHMDHAGGVVGTVRAAARRGETLPAYLTRPTAALLDWEGYERPPVRYFEAGGMFEIGDLQIRAVSVAHDCCDPVAFVVTDRSGAKAVVALDLGSVPEALTYYARGAGLVMLESNYDGEMLRTGSYPEHLKKRITGELGHLSNAACRSWIRREMPAGVRHVVLAHLSRQNNTPQTAHDGAAEALASRGLNCDLSVATYQSATPVIEVSNA